MDEHRPKKESGDDKVKTEGDFSLIKNLSPILIQNNRRISSGTLKARTSMEMPVFREVTFEGEENSIPVREPRENSTGDYVHKQRDQVGPPACNFSTSKDEEVDEEWDEFNRTVIQPSMNRPHTYKTTLSGSYSPRFHFDDTQSINSNYQVNDDLLFSDDCPDSEQHSSVPPQGVERVYRKPTPSTLPPAHTSSINVREMASFLERTDSFIRRFEATGKNSHSRSGLVNEVSSRPFISRQTTERFSWNSGVSSQSFHSNGNHPNGVLMIEQGVELQRENHCLRGRLLDLQKRLEKSERENLKLHERIKKLELLCGITDKEKDDEEHCSRSDSASDSTTLSLVPQLYEYSQQSMTELLTNMGFADEVIQQVIVQLELEYQR